MEPHIRYLIKPDMPHNDRVKAAVANNSGLGKWKVTPHLDQNMDKPWKSHDTGVPRTGRMDVHYGRVKTWVVIILCAVQYAK